MILDRTGLMLASVGQAAGGRLKKALAAHGLKPGHGHVLMLLSDGGCTTQQGLLEALGVDPSMLVTILNDLERDGLAERHRDPSDRRRHIVMMSDRGARLVADLQSTITTVEAELLADLDDDEIATLRDLLSRIKPAEDDEDCSADR